MIYTVTMVQYNGHIPTTELLNKRCWGYYLDLDEAKLVAMDSDTARLPEKSEHWQWIVVEEILPGIITRIRGKYWFEYNKDKKRYLPIDPPGWSNYTYSWGMG